MSRAEFFAGTAQNDMHGFPLTTCGNDITNSAKQARLEILISNGARLATTNDKRALPRRSLGEGGTDGLRQCVRSSFAKATADTVNRTATTEARNDRTKQTDSR